MMKKFNAIITIALALASCVNAQVNLDTGDQWIYEEFTSAPIYGIGTIEIIGDTIINGQACKILDGECNCAVSDLKFIYADANQIYRYEEETNDFYLLYDFDKIGGESWDLYLGQSLGSVQIDVDSVSHLQIGNSTFPLPVQYISYDEIIDFGEYIIPGIGSNKCLFPQGNICDPQTGPIRCFANASGETFSSNPNIACDSILQPPNSTSAIEFQDILMYPNPTDGILNISNINSLEMNAVEILSFDGRLLYTEYVDNSLNIELNLNHLETGILIVKIVGDKWTYFQKVIHQ